MAESGRTRATPTLRQRLARALPRDSAAGVAVRRAASAAEVVARTAAAPFFLAGDALHMGRAWQAGGPGIGRSPHGRTIVMPVVADVHGDPRVRQEARALAAAGFDVVVMWPELAAKITEPIDWGPRIVFERLPPSASRFAYRFPAVLGVGMLRAALAHRPFAFHGHDLTTALVALIAARRTGAHAVCDFHEWFSEHVTWSSWRGRYRPLGAIRKATNKRLERLAFDHASAVVTVCTSIAEAMDRDYGDGRPRVHVVRNISPPDAPTGTQYPSLRRQLQLDDQQFLILYQGGIGPSRALEPVIRALSLAPGAVLAIRGPSIAWHKRPASRRTVWLCCRPSRRRMLSRPATAPTPGFIPSPISAGVSRMRCRTRFSSTCGRVCRF